MDGTLNVVGIVFHLHKRATPVQFPPDTEMVIFAVIALAELMAKRTVILIPLVRTALIRMWLVPS